MKRCTVAILPAGQWGTTLALPLAENGHEVRLWLRRPEAVRSFNATQENEAKLPGVRLPGAVRAYWRLPDLLAGADLIVFAPAAAALREICRETAAVLETLSAAGRPAPVAVSACKSIEPETLLRMSQVIAAEVPRLCDRVVALSGPNFALEIAQGLPSATVAACPDLELAELVQSCFMTPRFRVYTNPDIAGVELGGALKNVIAIAVGIADGLGSGQNAAAALITRGLAEIARLGIALGANPLTFAGLSGMGDLVLTCTGSLSRNRGFGLEVGRGTSPRELLAGRRTVVEGVRTAQAAYSLARQKGISMPITEQLYQVLYEGLDPRRAMQALMGRSRTQELEELDLYRPL